MATKVKTKAAPKAAKGKKWVYLFDEVKAAEKYAGNWEGVRSLLGGKGSGLADMTRAGVPVPPGLTVTTEACNAFLAEGDTFPAAMWEQVLDALNCIQQQVGKTLGDVDSPLLVSVRSGAKFSMTGMMDTVLNLGLNDAVADGMVKITGDPRFVYDAYRRLVQMFGSVVMGIPDEPFEDYLTSVKKARGVKSDVELNASDWKHITDEFKKIFRAETGEDFPQVPH